MRRTRFAIVFALAAAVLWAGPASQATFPGQNGDLAYRGLRDTDSSYRIYVRSGATEMAITPDGGWAYQPDWSPATGRIIYVFDANLTNERDLWTAHPDGTDRQRLTFSPAKDEANPTWSPNGNKIVYTDHGTYRIYIMRADGSGKRLLADLAGEGSALSWSPDGRFLAVEGYRKNTVDILLIKVSDGSKRWVTSTIRMEGQPDWSPNGKRLVFHRRMGSQDDLFSIRPDGTGERRLTNTADIWESGAVWSPEGTQIAFVRYMPDPFDRDLAIMPASGGAPSVVYDTYGDDFDISWQAT
jgi:Tol biopolymer transport system component